MKPDEARRASWDDCSWQTQINCFNPSLPVPLPVPPRYRMKRGRASTVFGWGGTRARAGEKLRRGNWVGNQGGGGGEQRARFADTHALNACVLNACEVSKARQGRYSRQVKAV